MYGLTMMYKDSKSLLWAKIIDDVIITQMIEFDIICNVGHDSAAKFKLSFYLMTIQYGRQLQSQVIMETKNETKSW